MTNVIEGEGYEGLSPQDLNSQLLHLLELLPANQLDIVDGIIDVMDEYSGGQLEAIIGFANASVQLEQSAKDQADHHSRGELKPLFMARYQGIMHHSVATPACNSYLEWLISEIYDDGANLNKKMPLDGYNLHYPLYAFTSIVDDVRANAQPGGLFSKDSVGPVELEIYDDALVIGYGGLRIYGGISMSITKILGGDPYTVPISNIQLQTRMCKIPLLGDTVWEAFQNNYAQLSIWNTQIENRYGVTPLKPERPALL